MDVRLSVRRTPWCARCSVVGLLASALVITIDPTSSAQQFPAMRPPPAESQQLQLIYSPWTKFCFKGQETNGQQVCFTGEDGKVESGMPVVSVVLIEREGEAKKLLRVILPLGMQLPQGTRAIVDQGQPTYAPYVICFADGCIADYEASEELINNMKKGQWLAIQGFNSQGQGISMSLPLSEFGRAYDGPPSHAKAFEDKHE